MSLFQLRGIAEAIIRSGDFRVLRRTTDDETEIATWRRDLSRPGRLTARMNWYRANFVALTKADFPRARVPVLGIIGSADVALTRTQMANSARFVDAPFHWHLIEDAGHWLPLHAPADVERLAIDFLKSPN